MPSLLRHLHSPSRDLSRRVARAALYFNLLSALIWLMLVVPTILYWRDSILWIALMSVWANLAASVAGLTASVADPKTE